jgi:hypothetical protein
MPEVISARQWSRNFQRYPVMINETVSVERIEAIDGLVLRFRQGSLRKNFLADKNRFLYK